MKRKEILPEDIWNDKKMNDISGFVNNHKSKLSKENSVIVLYDLEEGYDYFTVDVNKDYGDYSGRFSGEFQFQNELDELDIKLEFDEYIYYGDMTKEELKQELLSRGFKIELR